MKEILIGELLLRAVKERGIQEEYLCEFCGCSASEISEMYEQKNIEFFFMRVFSGIGRSCFKEIPEFYNTVPDIRTLEDTDITDIYMYPGCPWASGSFGRACIGVNAE